MPSSPKVAAPTPPPVPSNLTRSDSRKRWQTIEIEPTPDLTTYSLRPDWKFDRSQATARNIDDVNWESIIGLSCSEDGSDGVFFVETESGSFVLKGSSTVGADLFAYELAKLYRVPVPRMRVIGFTADEWHDMWKGLGPLEAHVNKDSAIATPLGKCMQKAFMCVMDLSLGSDMEHLEKGEAAKIFKNEAVLKELGRVLAFDMLVNNWDRLPCIWDNDGNPNNILFSNDGASLAAIDTSITSIDPEQFGDSFNHYFDRVRSLMSSVYAHPKDPPSEIVKLQEFILHYTGCQLDNRDLLHVMNGMEEIGHSIATTPSSQFEKLRDGVSESVDESLRMCHFTPDCIGLNRVNTQYLAAMTKAFVDNM